jgi:hypothetical protein
MVWACASHAATAANKSNATGAEEETRSDAAIAKQRAGMRVIGLEVQAGMRSSAINVALFFGATAKGRSTALNRVADLEAGLALRLAAPTSGAAKTLKPSLAD